MYRVYDLNGRHRMNPSDTWRGDIIIRRYPGSISGFPVDISEPSGHPRVVETTMDKTDYQHASRIVSLSEPGRHRRFNSSSATRYSVLGILPRPRHPCLTRGHPLVVETTAVKKGFGRLRASFRCGYLRGTVASTAVRCRNQSAMKSVRRPRCAYIRLRYLER